MGIFTGWWRKKDKDKEPEGQAAHTLPDFVRGIQHAVNTGVTMYEKNAAAFLDRHLEEDGSPRIQKVKIPNTPYQLHVPTMTTTHPPNMNLEEMEVRMSVRIDRAQSKRAHPNSAADETRSSFQVSVTGTGDGGSAGKRQSNVVDLTMKFRRGDPPEGVARIMEEFVRSITPVDGKGEPPERRPEAGGTGTDAPPGDPPGAAPTESAPPDPSEGPYAGPDPAPPGSPTGDPHAP